MVRPSEIRGRNSFSTRTELQVGDRDYSIHSLGKLDIESLPLEFDMRVRLDTPRDLEYYRHGGITPYVVRKLIILAGT